MVMDMYNSGGVVADLFGQEVPGARCQVGQTQSAGKKECLLILKFTTVFSRPYSMT